MPQLANNYSVHLSIKEVITRLVCYSDRANFLEYRKTMIYRLSTYSRIPLIQIPGDLQLLTEVRIKQIY